MRAGGPVGGPLPRLPNSFDGRYYGPVRETDVVGMFRPVWTD